MTLLNLLMGPLTSKWQAGWRAARVRLVRRRLMAQRIHAERGAAALRIQTCWRGHAVRIGPHDNQILP